MIGNLFSALAAKIYAGVAVAALTFAAVQTVRIEGFLFIEGYKEEVSRLQGEIASILAAQTVAAEKAETQRVATENKTAELARRADYAERELDTMRDAADRFRRTRSVRTFAGASCGPAAAAPLGAPEDSDGQGADGVVLTRNEWEQYVATTLRLERVRRWGESLVQAGLAVPEVEFSKEGED